MTELLQHVIDRLEQLPEPEQNRYAARFLRELEGGPTDLSTNKKHLEELGETASSRRLKERRALTEAARQHWKGGEGLAYQNRVRGEWKDRPQVMPSPTSTSVFCKGGVHRRLIQPVSASDEAAPVRP